MSIQIIIPRTQTIRELRKRVPLVGEGIGYTTESDGQEAVIYEVRLDYSAVHTMARRAAASKGQRSRDGALEVRILERRRI